MSEVIFYGAVLLPLSMLLWIFYSRVIVNIFLNPLSRMPQAHFSVCISGIWISRVRRSGCANKIIDLMHKQHGPVVRIGPNEVSINCVDQGVKNVYGANYEKGHWYGAFDYFGASNMFSTRFNSEHTKRRRLLSNIYSKSTLVNSSVLHEDIKVLHQRLDPLLAEAAKNGSPLNVFDLYRAATIDFVSNFLFGIHSGTNCLQDQLQRKEVFRMYGDEHKPLSSQLSFLKLITGSKEEGINPELYQFCIDMCDTANGKEKDQGSSKKEGLVFRQLQKAGLSGIDIASELVDHLTAGHQTSSATLAFSSYQLSACPDVQSKLRQELSSMGPIPESDSGALMASYLKSLDSLPILDAVVMETLRLFPPISGPQPRVSPARSTQLGSFDIPPGTQISAQAYSLHRNETVFPEPLRWIPERWLQGDSHEMRRWFWAFGSGGRMCIGSNFALIQVKLLVSIVYARFSSYLTDGPPPDPQDGYRGGPKSEVLNLRFSASHSNPE